MLDEKEAEVNEAINRLKNLEEQEKCANVVDSKIERFVSNLITLQECLNEKDAYIAYLEEKV